MTPARIEPATFRFIAQSLNHCATGPPPLLSTYCIVKINKILINKFKDAWTICLMGQQGYTDEPLSKPWLWNATGMHEHIRAIQ